MQQTVRVVTDNPGDIRLKLLPTALHLRDRASVPDTASWLYAMLGRVGHPEPFVGGHAITCLAPEGQPGASQGATFRTPFQWDAQYDGYAFDLFGLVVPAGADASRCPPEMLYPLTMDFGPELGPPRSIVLLVYTARMMKPDVPIRGQAEWRPGWRKVEYSYVGVTPGGDNRTKVADDGLRLFRGMRLPKRGPKPGTVAKFKTREAWLEAIRERVLNRRTLATADDETIAHWLGISSSLLYELFKRWGPPRSMPDLREGNF